ncbi:MAG: AraC-like DNA-binding protein [Psychromonas sp.]|uniref:helix-turn-helix domain-containing protein n=1 Tax=Psychromonas sp. TaxID=1884585 RepID=UPI0039E36B70
MLLAEDIAWEISIIGLTLCIFSLTNIATQSRKRRTDILLCCWLIILVLPLIHAVLAHLELSFPLFIMYTNPAVNLIQGPLLYCYVLLLIREKERFQPFDLLHLLPFTLFYALFISASYTAPMLPNPEQMSMPITAMGEASYFMTISKPLMINFGLVHTFFFFSYSILTVVLLVKHQKRIGVFFSQNDNQINLKWIYLLPTSFAFLVLINIANENNAAFSTLISPLTLHLLSYLSFIILLCFFGVKQKPVFNFDKPVKQNPTSIPEKKTRQSAQLVKTDRNELKQNEPVCEDTPETSNTMINEALLSEIITKMQFHMENDKPYLEAEFSVYHLAKTLNIPRRTLSYVLNNGLSKNFFQYVNEHRVEEVKIRLKSQESKQSTLLDIAFESGFKSKSSFNSLFKQYCHVTPSQYRKMIQEKKTPAKNDLYEN